jgi:hypothetical protein
VIEMVGGPAPGSPHPLSGVVELTSATGKHISFATEIDLGYALARAVPAAASSLDLDGEE